MIFCCRFGEQHHLGMNKIDLSKIWIKLTPFMTVRIMFSCQHLYFISDCKFTQTHFFPHLKSVFYFFTAVIMYFTQSCSSVFFTLLSILYIRINNNSALPAAKFVFFSSIFTFELYTIIVLVLVSCVRFVYDT